jgi:hypothetical protein
MYLSEMMWRSLLASLGGENHCARGVFDPDHSEEKSKLKGKHPWRRADDRARSSPWSVPDLVRFRGGGFHQSTSRCFVCLETSCVHVG